MTTRIKAQLLATLINSVVLVVRVVVGNAPRWD